MSKEKQNWEIKYEEYKKYSSVEDVIDRKEILSMQWEEKESEYKSELAGIKDTTSEEYKKVVRTRKNDKKEYDKKIEELKKYEEKFKTIKEINMPLVEKMKENRDVYQELLDELIEAENKNKDIIKRREQLGNEAERLDNELKELQETEIYCQNALNNPEATQEQKEHATRVLKETRKKINENQLGFSENQKELQKQLDTPLNEIAEGNKEELQARIDRYNYICEGLMEGKSMGDIQKEEGLPEIPKRKKETPKLQTQATPVSEPNPATQPNPAVEPNPVAQPSAAAQPNPAVEPNPVAQPSPATQSGPVAQPGAAAQPNPAVQPNPAAKLPTHKVEDIAEETFENQYAYNEGYDEEGKVKADKRIQSIRFVFESGKPQYIITTKSGHILTANVNAENQKLYEPATKEIKKKIDEELGFKRAHKFADPFLLKFLKDYDGANKTLEYERYVKILEDGSKRKFMNDDNEPEIMIDYDLNDKELAGMDKESIRNIQRLARKNDWYEIAIYTKAKGTIARLIDKYIKTPRLKAAKEATKEEEGAKRKELEEKKLGHDNEFKRGLRNRSTTKLFGGKEGKFSNPRQAKSKNKKGEAFEFTIEEIKEDEEVR